MNVTIKFFLKQGQTRALKQWTHYSALKKNWRFTRKITALLTENYLKNASKKSKNSLPIFRKAVG